MIKIAQNMSARSTVELVKTDERQTTQNVASCGDSPLTVVHAEPLKHQTSKQKKKKTCCAWEKKLHFTYTYSFIKRMGIKFATNKKKTIKKQELNTGLATYSPRDHEARS